MWVFFAIAVLTREVVATPGNDNIHARLPNANIEDEIYDLLMTRLSDSTLGSLTENEWENKDRYPFQDEDVGDINFIAHNSGQMLKRSANFYTEPTNYITAMLKFLVKHFPKQRNSLILTYVNHNPDKDYNKNHTNTENTRNKRSTEEIDTEDDGRQRLESIPISSWLDWTAKDKIADQDLFQEKNSASSPWGGKFKVLKLNSKIRRPIRVPFNSWGGKRDDESLERQFFEDKRGKPYSQNVKLTPFNSWGGKRIPFNSWGGKRVPFNSWGGKRTQFNAWGGKRDGTDLDSWNAEDIIPTVETNLIEDAPDHVVSKRAEFNAWGGKRDSSGDSDDEQVKRTKFNAWGGKRSQMFHSRGGKGIPEEVYEKRNVFNAWGGKRSGEKVKPTEEIEEKRVPLGSIDGKKLKFSSWGGKRYATQITPQDINETERNCIDEVENNSVIEALVKRAGSGYKTALFNPWGGKRSGSVVDFHNDATNMAPESITIRKIFFPWGG